MAKNENKKDLEIEFKFSYGDDFEQKLLDLGATCKTEAVQIVDQYFDNSETNFLTLNDYWLRIRNGNWELKYPDRQIVTSDASIAQYYELTGSNQICEFILKLAKQHLNP